MRRVIVDTGPLVALMRPSDQHHQWMRETVAGIAKPLYTCEAVISEAAYLVQRLPDGRAKVLELLVNGVVSIAFRMEPEVRALHTLVARYRSVPMSIADACLVRMSELLPDASVLTFDSGFRVFRRGGRHSVPVIMPGKS